MALNQTQIDELNRAYARLGTAQEGDRDRTNIEYAKTKYGWVPGAQTSGSVARDFTTGGVVLQNKPNPRFALTDLQNKTSFLDMAKNIVMKKQGMNSDIGQARAYFRTVGADTSPFGGKRDPALTGPGFFEDAAMRELSPADQASVRASRSSAVQAFGRGLEEEEEYRGQRVEDIMSTFEKLYEEARLKKDDERKDEELRLDRLKAQADLGIQPTAEEIYGNKDKAVGNKVGGTASWRNNNPLNIKWGAFGKSYEGASEGSKATDGGSFTNFATVEQGWKAAADLWRSKTYADLSVDKGLRLWSGGGKDPSKGYGAKDIERISGMSMPFLYSKKVKDLTEPELMAIMNAQRTLEGWQEGSILGSDTQTSLDMTDAKKFEILKSLGTDDDGNPLYSVSDTKDWTTEDWLAIQDTLRKTQFTQAQELIKALEEQKSNPNQIYSELQRQYGNILNSTDIKTIMNLAGYTTIGGITSETWVKQ